MAAVLDVEMYPSIPPPGVSLVLPKAPRPKHILVIDDDPVAGAVYRTALELDGFFVSLATNGHAGLEVIRITPPDLILLDILMPIMDGWEVLAHLRQTGSSVPVVVSSATTDAVRALSAGATAWHPKTSSLSNLRDICRGLLVAGGAGQDSSRSTGN